MIIDWFTVGAQIVNFLILIFLLKKFLYGPIVKAMRNRQERIESRLAEAGAKEQEAEELLKGVRADRQELEESREKVLGEARREAEEYRREQKQQAREEVQRMREAWLASLSREQESFYRELRAVVAESSIELAARSLEALGGTKLQELALTTLLSSLGKDGLPREMADSGPYVVKSGFDLDGEGKEALAKLLSGDAGGDGVEFVVDADVGPGVRILAGDRKMDWGFPKYFADLRSEVAGLLPQAGRQAEAEEEAEGKPMEAPA